MSRARREWGLLAYRLPREPSTPRIALWRKLRRLGVEQLVDGLVALPLDPRHREQLEWLAEEVVEAGGWAMVWTAQLASEADERALTARMRDRAREEYRALLAKTETADATPRTVSRLRRELRDIRARDFFAVEERERAERAVEALATRGREVRA